jgi:hypothetical protein
MDLVRSGPIDRAHEIGQLGIGVVLRGLQIATVNEARERRNEQREPLHAAHEDDPVLGILGILRRGHVEVNAEVESGNHRATERENARGRTALPRQWRDVLSLDQARDFLDRCAEQDLADRKNENAARAQGCARFTSHPVASQMYSSVSPREKA